MYSFAVRYRGIIILVAASAVIRLMAVEVWSSSVTDDRDSYLALAEQLRTGAGYSNPHTQQPTAFRPPLLPIILSGMMTIVPTTIAVALLNITLGSATVVLTWIIARQLGLGRMSWCAAGWVCIDPLLIRYTAWPMTETLATFLICAALALSFLDSTDPKLRLLTGVTMGLAVLCRPALWVIAGILVAVELLKSQQHQPWRIRLRGVPWYALLGMTLIVGPWLTRNLIRLDAPVLTTTHGGYTLLLANNPTFIEQVVRQPWGTVWSGPSLTAWQTNLDRQLTADGVPNDEVARDRWMYRRALSWIRAHPRSFARGVWFRFRRFWNPQPVGSTAPKVPQGILVLVTAFYSLTFLLAGLGLMRSGPDQRARIRTLAAIIVSLCLVHCVYWSNTRFRSPVTPMIAVLAASGLAGHRRPETADHKNS